MKYFFGVSINVIKAKIWITLCAYLLVLIAIKHHRLPVSLKIFLSVVETNLFEKVTLDELVAKTVLNEENRRAGNQLTLLWNRPKSNVPEY